MQKNLKKDAVFVLAAMVAFLVLLIFALPAAAAVTVYAEGAYTGDDLVVYVYADIDTDAICSAGVKLTYDNTVLTVDSAVKNDAVWFMGDSSPGHSYMNPEDAGDGVIVICGKLDTSAPTDGVIGDRVLLGIVTFSRNDGGAVPPDPAVAEDYFGVTVELGRVDPFANFVTTGGVELDADADPVPLEPVAFTGATVRERGDANGNGELTTQDMAALRYYIVNGGIGEIWKDCNGVDGINTQDMACIRYKLTH
ncbi:MAG: hypothetical protein DRP62_01700 [Planctomycetota bacterium]|nr:MAG: hypothetical protein DRP62_01700 [Planctomycetota bacterium]